MMSDREIKRFADRVETEEEFFFALDALVSKFNGISMVITPADIAYVFCDVMGRDITEDEMDTLLTFCSMNLEHRLDQEAMLFLKEMCHAFEQGTLEKGEFL